MIRGVLFDFDGTLVDTNDLIIESLNETARATLQRPCTEEELQEILGRPLAEQMAYLAPEHVDKMVAYYRRVYRARRDAMTRLFPGIKEMLDALAGRGIRMAILSNKGRSGIDHGLEHLGLSSYMDLALSADDVTRQKPHPEGIVEILGRWQMVADEVLMVGDSPHDLEAARAAKVRAVYVGWSLVDLPAATYDYRIERPKDLLALL